MALSLYRKYRPRVFSDVVGQEHVERTLVNAVTEGNVAHAYLFCGPRGTGKTTTARLLAKALLCERGPGAEPDGTCPQCQAIANGTHPDVYELDAASRTGVDNVREEIISRVNFAPTQGRYKVYIIDEVHMLSTAAFNSLLKTLEEPPEHVVFIMCTTDPHKVPDTIQSRCQRFDFRRFSIDEIVGYLERICEGEGFSYETEALEYLAAKSAGGMRDATTSLEQVAVFSDGNITLGQAKGLFGQMDSSGLFDLCDRIARHDAAGCFVWVNDLVTTGIDLRQFAHELATHVRNLYVALLTGGEGGIIPCSHEQLAEYRRQAGEFGGPDCLAHALDVCGRLLNELRNASDPRLSVEIALVRLCRPESDLTLEGLAARLEALESARLRGGAGMVPPERPSASRPAPADGAVVESLPVPREQRQRNVSEIPARAEQGPKADRAVPRETSTGAAAGNNMSPARLLAALLTAVKRVDVSTGALLDGVDLERSDDGYVLCFPEKGDFAMSIARGPEASKIISAAFEQVLGHPVQYSCRIGAGGSSPVPSNASAWSERRAVPVADEPPVDDRPPMYEELIYDDGRDDDFHPAPQRGERRSSGSDDTAANLADVLSAFGRGVTVQEVDDDE